MSYIKYDINVTQSLYQDYEGLRKSWQHEHLSRLDILELLDSIGLPSKSPRLWELVRKYNLVLQHGIARNTYYVFPMEQPAYSRFTELEKEFYNGCKPKAPKPIIKEEELKRVPITEEYCIDYLKKTGKYLILELDPNVEKLKNVLNPHILLDMSEVKIR